MTKAKTYSKVKFKHKVPMAYSAKGFAMPSSRFRLRYVFWLDLHKHDEAEIAETIEVLKRQRSFASTIRDGIRLICDLRAGRLDVLCELFPWVANELAPPQAASKETDNLKTQLARLEQLMLQQGGAAKPGVPKPLLTNHQFSAPYHEDDDDSSTLNLRPDTNTDAGQNFIKSMMSLQH